MNESHRPTHETPLEALGLIRKDEQRLHNCLRRAGYTTVEQVVTASDDELLAVSGLGPRSIGFLCGRIAETHLAPGETRLALLGLSERPLAALKSRGILTREQALALTLGDFLVIPGLILSSRMEVLEMFGAMPPEPEGGSAAAGGLEMAEADPAALLADSLDAWADAWLATLGHDRQEETLRLRYGLDGAAPAQAEAATASGRQRAQQVEKAALGKLRQDHSLTFMAPFVALITDLLAGAGGLADDAELAGFLRSRLNVGRLAPVPIARLALDAWAGRRTARPNGLWLLAPLTEEHVASFQESITQALSGAAVVLSEEQIMAAADAQPFPYPAPPVGGGDFLRACLRLHPHVMRLGEGYVLTRRQRIGAIFIALGDRPRPVHYTQIAAAANTLLAPPQRASPETLHALMERHPAIFRRFGHGKFKLTSPDDPRDASVPDAVCRVLGDAREPLHYEEVTLRVLSDWEVAPASIHAAINRDPRVRACGRGFFGLRDLRAEAGPAVTTTEQPLHVNASPLVDVWKGMQRAAEAGDVRKVVRRINLQRKQSDIEMLIGRPLTKEEGQDLLHASSEREFLALAAIGTAADRLMSLRQAARGLAARGDTPALVAVLQAGIETAQAAASGEDVQAPVGCVSVNSAVTKS